VYTTQIRTSPPRYHIWLRNNTRRITYADRTLVGAMQGSQSTYSFRGKRIDTDSELWVPTNSDRFPPRIQKMDTGHEFWTTRTSVKLSHPRWLQRWKSGAGDDWEYIGALVPLGTTGTTWPNNSPSAPVLARLTDAEKARWGSEAINATIPTKPSVSMAQFLGELSRLPSVVGQGLLREQASWYRGLGSEYLNVAFGWIPFISDLVGAVEALRNRSEILRQYHRDSGNLVRRRWSYTFNDVATDKVFTNSVGPIYTGSSLAGSGAFVGGTASPINETVTKLSQYSFAGAYKYYIPLGEGVLGKLQQFEMEADRLLGTRLTPAVLWELAPWSWLIDWHGTIGTVLENASRLAGDELVLQYGYLMRETTHQRTLRVSNLSVQEWDDPGPITAICRRVTKERVRANPYGFTLSTADYTGQQWAILGALGLTKAPRIL
jgi:hypothetical protein